MGLVVVAIVDGEARAAQPRLALRDQGEHDTDVIVALHD
jgi:hypothetical protein